jgi:peptide/nickel transport system substrate-binding protein
LSQHVQKAVRWRSLSRFSAIALAASLFLSACGGTGSKQAEPPKSETPAGSKATAPAGKATLKIGIPADVVTLDPQMATDLYSGMAYDQMFEPVVRRDFKGDPAQGLASEWKVAADNLTWTFKIRKGVKFHNGKEMTMDDVVFSAQRLMDPKEASPRQAQFASAIDSVKADGENLVIKLKQPNAAFLSLMAYCYVVPKEVVTSLGKEGFAKAPVGTGPYKFVERKADDHVTLAAFADYWGGKPAIDEVILRPIPDASTRTVELETGGIDLMPSVAPQDVDRLQKNANVKVETATGANFRFLFFNTEKAPFNDKRLRQAVAYAINKDQLIKTIYPGVAIKAVGPIPPMSFAFDKEFKGIDFNLDKAKALIKEIGTVPPIEYTTSSGDLNQREAQLVQAMLTAAGFQVTIKQLEWGAFLDATKNGNYQFARLGWTTTPEPNDLLFNRYHTGAPDFNSSRYSSKPVDELLEKGLLEQDPAKRAEIYRQAQKLIVEDVPEYHIFHESRVYAVNKKVQGFKAHFGGGIYLWVPGLDVKVTLSQS